jgi:uncharacterized integral membrane protein
MVAMSTPGRYDPADPNAVPYDIANAPTPPGGLPVAEPPTSAPVEPYPPAAGYGDTAALGPAASGTTPDPTAPGAGRSTSGQPPHKHSRTGAAWVALVVAAIVLIFLLIFIVQNSDPVQVEYFGLSGSLPLGVAMLFAAIAGALTAGLLGTVRILQLRARAKRAGRPG